MKKILALYSSVSGEHATSTQLVKEWLGQQSATAEIIERDLNADPVPHLGMQTLSGFATPEDQQTEAQAAGVALSNSLINEVKQADTLILGIPMYNFGIPSTLKAWIDHIARAGETFQYTAEGPQGLMTGKKAIVVFTSGGTHKNTPLDLQSPYIKLFLNFIGITEIEFIYAEGTALGEGAVETAKAAAQQQLALVTA